MGGDESLLREVLGIFLADSGRLLDDGRRAVLQGDREGLKRMAHTIRGASGHFHAREVSAAASRLEASARSADAPASALASEFDALRSALDRFTSLASAQAEAVGSF